MAESDDEWAKVREMVRNAPAGTAQTQWNPHELAEEPAQRTFPKKALWLLPLIAVVGGGYYAYENRDQAPGASDTAPASTSKTEGPDGTGPAPSTAPSPTAPSVKPGDAKIVSIRRGTKSINVRASPSAESAIVGRLSGGDRAEKIGESDGWARLRFQATGKATEGWVRVDLLSE